jgi:hypothetical protein
MDLFVRMFTEENRMIKLNFRMSSIILASLLAIGVSNSALFAGQAKPKAKSSQSVASTQAKVDLNTASEKELVDLPGVGTATAKKIIAGRPYSSVDGLSKAGISAGTISKISSLVTVGGAPAAADAGAKASSPKTAPPVSQPAPAASSQPTPVSPPARTPAKSATASSAQGNPGAGMVWVNLDSGVYHYEGSRYYGKTKTGKYMSESDATAAGYHAAKNEKKPQ